MGRPAFSPSRDPMTTNPVTELTAQIATAKAAYLAIVDTAPRAQVEAASRAVTILQRQLLALIADGGKPCPEDAVDPIGLKKRPGVYEVGCPVCTRRSRGETPAEAV